MNDPGSRPLPLPNATGGRPGCSAAANLPTLLRDLIRDVGLPNGLAELGFGPAEHLAGVFAGSFEHW